MKHAKDTSKIKMKKPIKAKCTCDAAVLPGHEDAGDESGDVDGKSCRE